MEHYCPICKKTHGLIKEIDGTQPIYVGFNTRYKGVSFDGYLPAFYPERLCKPNLTGVRGEAIQSPTPAEQANALAALSGRVAYLDRRVGEMEAKRREATKKSERKGGVPL